METLRPLVQHYKQEVEDLRKQLSDAMAGVLEASNRNKPSNARLELAHSKLRKEYDELEALCTELAVGVVSSSAGLSSSSVFREVVVGWGVWIRRLRFSNCNDLY